MILIAALLCSTLSLATTPFLPRWQAEFTEKVGGAVERFDEIATDAHGYQLKRIDLDLSLSSKLGVLLFSKEKEKGIELIWERRKAPALPEEDSTEITIEAGVSAQATAEQMLPSVLAVLSEARASSRVRRRVIERLYRDATELTASVQTLARFNRTAPSWLVANYFKVYHFSASGELLFAGTSYDKRLRFRFRTPQLLEPRPAKSRRQQRLENRLRRLSEHLARVSAQDRAHHRFVLNRARSVETTTVGVSAGIGDASLGRGLLLEWVPAPQKPSLFDKHWPSPTLLRQTADALERSIPDSGLFELTQIRLKSSREAEVELLFLSASRGRDIEYHYRRRL